MNWSSTTEASWKLGLTRKWVYPQVTKSWRCVQHLVPWPCSLWVYTNERNANFPQNCCSVLTEKCCLHEHEQLWNNFCANCISTQVVLYILHAQYSTPLLWLTEISYWFIFCSQICNTHSSKKEMTGIQSVFSFLFFFLLNKLNAKTRSRVDEWSVLTAPKRIINSLPNKGSRSATIWKKKVEEPRTVPTSLKQQRNAVKFVYLHSDDSINVNLTEESKGKWNILRAQSRAHSSELCSYK